MTRRKKKLLKFADFPEFKPNLTPQEVLQMGSFGGTYFRPIESGVTGKRYGKVAWKELPEDWLKACVTAIHKKGEKNLPGNYRPVSITSIICKLMESIVRDKIVDHMVQNNLFSKQQHGFVPFRDDPPHLFRALDRNDREW